MKKLNLCQGFFIIMLSLICLSLLLLGLTETGYKVILGFFAGILFGKILDGLYE